MIDGILRIREMQPETDEKFVCRSWLESVKHEARVFTGPKLGDGVFFNNYHHFLMPLLSISKTLVACNSEDPDQIYGYLTFQNDCIHFCYVKRNFRNFHIAKSLIDQAKQEMDSIIEYSISTRFTKYILRYFDSTEYNPFRFFRYGAVPSRKS